MIVWETFWLGWRIRKLVVLHIFANTRQAICRGYLGQTLLAFGWGEWRSEKLKVHLWVGCRAVVRLLFTRRHHGVSDACLNIDVVILRTYVCQCSYLSFGKFRDNCILCCSIKRLVAPSSLAGLLVTPGGWQTFFSRQLNSISCSINYHFAAPIHNWGVFWLNQKVVRFLSFTCLAPAICRLFGCKPDFFHVLELFWTTIASVASGNFRAHCLVC